MTKYRPEPLSLSTRIELTVEMLKPVREWGRVKALSEEHAVSRPWLYKLRSRGQAALEAALAPINPGPKLERTVLEVDESLIRRAITVLPMLRGSVREIQLGLELLLKVKRSVGYIQGTLDEVGRNAWVYNAGQVPSSPVLGEADEIFCGEQPCLTVVDGNSFMVLNLSAAEARDETTWGLKFLELMERGIVFDDLATDGALGIQAGARAAGLHVPIRHDLFHLMQDGTKISQRLEREMRQAGEQRDAAWQALDEITAPKRRPGRPRQSTGSLPAAEDALTAALELYANWTWLLQAARQALEPMTPSGQIASAAAARQTIYAAAQLMRELPRVDIATFADGLVDKLPKLLAPISALEETLADVRQGLPPALEAFITHLWLYRHEHKLTPEQLFPPTLQPFAQPLWLALSHFHRSSSLAESFHAWLRPFLEIHRSLPAWLAALLQLFWNHHTFTRGKRAGHSPLALANHLDVPSLAEAIDSILRSPLTLGA